MSDNPRVFVLGIDGASWNVLDPAMARGDMPQLAAWLSQALRSDLESVTPPITTAAWASFHTGLTPLRHGVFDFRGFDPRTCDLWFNNFEVIRSRTVWERLSQGGRRVGVVHVPMTFPPPPVNGVAVSGFETPSTESAFCHPPELRSQVLQWFPDYLFGPDRVVEDVGERTDALLAAGCRGLQQRAELVERLHQEQSFDVFMVNFQELDWLLHKIYGYVTAESDPLWSTSLRARVREFIHTLDACIGRVLKAARTYDIVFMVSDHGFTREWGLIYPNDILRSWGLYVPKPAAEAETTDSWRRLFHRMESSQWALARAVAGAVRGWRRRRRSPWVVEQQVVSAAEIEFDATQTTAAVVASDMYGLLYLNRHPSGPLRHATAEERERLCGELAARFRGLTNPATERPLFVQVIECESEKSCCRGTPDLILIPEEGVRAISGSCWFSKHVPSVAMLSKVDSAGTHRKHGLFAARGMGIAPGRLLRNPKLVDIAPTLLGLAGVSIPDDLDGAVITEVMSGRSVMGSVVRNRTAEVSREAPADPYTEDDRRTLEQRLRSLGYLE